jgi:hypothetical protein
VELAEKTGKLRVGLALFGFEEASDHLANFGDDGVNDHDADQEGDEGQFVGCAEGEHRGLSFPYHLRRRSG